MQMPTVNWSFNAHTIIAVLVSTAANYAVTVNRVDAQEKKTTAIEAKVDAIPAVLNQLTIKDVDYGNRLENVIDSVKEIRRVSNEQLVAQARTNSEVLTQLSAIRETLAWFRAKSETDGRNPPFKP